MIISDLNYMEVAAAEVAGARGFRTDVTVNERFRTNSRINNILNNNVNSSVSLTPGTNVSTINGSVDAFGPSTLTDLNFAAQSEPGFSGAAVSGTAISQSPVRRRRGRKH